jgi:3-hydroxymyristoyl/3-hydroxydecanoyl-(acyl carrier protein) dehydratase
MNAAQLPDVVNVMQAGTHVLLEARVPETLAFFAGHFPGAPVVAGVVQVAWVEHYARQHLGLSGAFRGMEQLKFQRLMRPHDSFTMRIDLAESGGQLTFRLSNAKHVFSSGRLLYRS